MPKEKIAGMALGVIDEYQTVVGYPVKPPIPVEDIIERYLGVSLCFKDFEENRGMEGILGATYIDKRLICVSTRLLDEPTEGRLNFTWAHEAGHWVMHRKFVNKAKRVDFENDTILCRIKDAKRPIEWQADYFASCLLMPENEIRTAWDETYGSEPLTLHNVKSAFSGPLCFDPCVKNWHLIADRVRAAGGFSNVSKQAMIIKLQDLGLIKNKTGARIGWPRVFFQKTQAA